MREIHVFKPLWLRHEIPWVYKINFGSHAFFLLLLLFPSYSRFITLFLKVPFSRLFFLFDLLFFGSSRVLVLNYRGRLVDCWQIVVQRELDDIVLLHWSWANYLIDHLIANFGLWTSWSDMHWLRNKFGIVLLKYLVKKVEGFCL